MEFSSFASSVTGLPGLILVGTLLLSVIVTWLVVVRIERRAAAEQLADRDGLLAGQRDALTALQVTNASQQLSRLAVAR